MKVGELKAFLKDVPDDYGVTLKVTISDEDPGIACGTVRIGYLIEAYSAYYISNRWGTVVLVDRPIERKPEPVVEKRGQIPISAGQGVIKR